jgi:signal transduction histidine kinase
LLALLGGAFLLFTVVSFQHYSRETVSNALIARAGEIWTTTQGLLDDPAGLRALIERRFAPEAQNRFIRISRNGVTLYSSGEPADGDFVSHAIALPEPNLAARTTLQGNLLLHTGSFQSALGAVTIESGQSFRFARDFQNRLALSLLVGLPVLLLFAALGGYVLMRRALTPVEMMINAAEAYTFNDPHSRLPLVGTDPRIEALGLALNRMLDRLDGAYSHVSRFSADAAHELRTPLTIIRGELELAAMGRQSADVDRAIDNALEEMTRLSGIVDSLITLSRMESLWGKRAHSSIDLSTLAAETMDQMNLMAVEKGIALDRPDGPPVLVAGDRERLKQVLVNLIDNAIKYTPIGGHVSVTVAAAGDIATLTVEDNGIGIDPAHHERVFDRFYRVSTDRGTVGAGLGLAIVKSICHAHGGTVTLRSAPEMGSAFVIELPLLKSETIVAEENKMAAADTAAATSFVRRET